MSHPATNEFEAAKLIVDALKGLDQQQQDRAIRFASESVGLRASPASPAQVNPPSPPGVPPESGLQNDPLNRNVDIKQFVESKAPKSDQQFATVVAYYYRFVAPRDQQKELIGADDLKNSARLVGRKQPGDAGATLINAKNSGYLDPVGKGQYQINSVGENLVAITLPGNGTNGQGKKASTPRKKKTKQVTAKKRSNKNGK